MIKIWLDTSMYLINKTGIGAYILMLLNCFKNLSVDYKCVELKMSEKVKYKPLWVTIWHNTILFIQTVFKKPDIIIFPCCLMPFLKVKGTKYITIVHDLCSFKGYMKNNVAVMHRYGINLSARKADLIVTVSEASKNDLIEILNISPEKIKVIYNTVAKHFENINLNNELLDLIGVSAQKYILSVATLNKHKNIPELIKAFEQISDKYPDIKLVLVGGMGNEKRKKLTKHPNIIFTGYLKDEEIPVLYKNALLYMYPSLYEGFGIPLIEAQYCGCPVLCSDIPVFREIGLNSVDYCNPNAECIANGIDNLINNEKRLKELSELGKENVKRFALDKIIKQLKEVLDV